MKTKTKASKYYYLPIFAVVLGTVFFIIPNLTQASVFRSPEVRIFDCRTTRLDSSFLARDQSFRGGIDIAVGDLGGDGLNEIITGAGPSDQPIIKIFRSDGSEIANFLAYDAGFDKGVVVAVGDVNNDGKDEIISGTRYGGAPHVRVFDGSGNPLASFFAFREDFRGGVDVAAGDINGDGAAEIVVAAGTSGGPHIRAYSGQGNYIGFDIFPFASSFRGGLSITTANVDGGVEDEIVVGVKRYDAGRVKVYKTDQNKTILGDFLAFPDSFTGGVNLGAGDVDNDGYDEIIVAANANGGPQIRTFEAYGNNLTNFFAYEEDFRGGVRVDGGDVDNDGLDEIISAPNHLPIEGRTDLVKYIDVNLTEQMLYAYEYGVLQNSFLISSGIYIFPTPQGTFSVLEKLPVKRYAWSYGPNSPYNYNLGGVQWNMRFYNSFYLHGAYWHNNFGHRMSHGCVNIHNTNAEWLYNWTEVGTPVIVHN